MTIDDLIADLNADYDAGRFVLALGGVRQCWKLLAPRVGDLRPNLAAAVEHYAEAVS